MNAHDYFKALNRQRRRLADWLIEWRLERMLASGGETEESPEVDPVTGVDAGNAAQPFAGSWRMARGTATPISTGQIRLLAPEDEGTRSVPRYILVIARLPSANWIVAPFGRFAVPALPGEWKTGLRTLAIRVLCIWNARNVDASVLCNSWVVRRLDTQRWRQALRLTVDCFDLEPSIRSWLIGQAAGQSAPASTLGPPLLHPLDPRHEYLNTETAAMDALGSPPGRVAGKRCWRGDPMPGQECAIPWSYPVDHDPACLKAAERGPDYPDSADSSGD